MKDLLRFDQMFQASVQTIFDKKFRKVEFIYIFNTPKNTAKLMKKFHFRL